MDKPPRDMIIKTRMEPKVSSTQRMINRRRWFQFKLRTLLLATAASGLAMAVAHHAHLQRRAVTALLQSNPGAKVYYAYQLDARGETIAQPAPPATEWLRNRLGIDYFSPVAAIEMDYATDADLACLERLTNLRRLTLERSIDLTDQGLRHVGKLSHLRVLALLGAERVTDEGLRSLENLARLENLTLEVREDRVTREAIERLRRALPKCRVEIPARSKSDKDLARPRSGRPPRAVVTT